MCDDRLGRMLSGGVEIFFLLQSEVGNELLP